MDISQIQKEKTALQESIENMIYDFEQKTKTLVSTISFTPSERRDMFIESAEDPLQTINIKPVVRLKVSI